VEKEIQPVFGYVDPIVKRALETKGAKKASGAEGEDGDETLVDTW
jgi:hypothetical protein